MLVVDQAGDGVSRGLHHVVVDIRGAHVQGSAEDAREGQHVVDLVGEVRATGRGHGGAGGQSLVGHDLGHGVGAGKDDRVGGHRAHHVLGQRAGGRDTHEDVGALDGLGQRTRDLLLVGPGCDLFLHGVQTVAALVDGALTVADDDVLHAHALHQARDGDAGGTGAREDHLNVGQLAPGQATGVDQCGAGHDSSSVLVVVEDGDVADLLQAALDLKAARRADVLEVDAAKAAGQKLDGAHDLVDVVRAHAQRESVHVAKGLEQGALALHDGHAGLGANVTQAQHGRAVGHDGHQVAAARVGIGVVNVLVDLKAGLGDAGRVGHGQLLGGGDGGAADHLDLAVPLFVLIQRVLLCVNRHVFSHPTRAPRAAFTQQL